MNDENPLIALAVHIGLLSLLAIGGGLTVLPEIHRVAVDVYQWTTDSEFTEIFAIAQASPGPNILFVSLIGWKAAGLPGALVATAAICGPPCVLTFAVARVWERFRDAPWRRIVEAGIAPVTIGLVLSSGYLLTQAANAGSGWVGYAITAATVAVVLATRINPLWMLGVAAVLGILGVV